MRRGGEGMFLMLMAAGFLALTLWYMLRPQEVETSYPAYSSFSPLPDGSRALFTLLEREGFKVQRHIATEYDYPDGECMVVVLGAEDELQSIFSPSLDLPEMRSYIERGGTFVLIADTHGRMSMTIDEDLLGGSLDFPVSSTLPAGRQLSLVSSRQTGSFTAISRIYQPGNEYELSPSREPFFSDVNAIEIAQPGYMYRRSAAVLLGYGPDSPVLLYKKIGEGEFFWLTCPEIVTNDWIARKDNHQLLLAVLARAAQGRGITFDEYVHGYTGGGSNIIQLIFRTKGGALLLALCAAIILIYLGLAVSPARSEAMPVPPRRQASEGVLAQADLYRRAGIRGAVASHLVDGLRRALMEARHETAPPANIELLRWIRESGLDQTLADQTLLTYLSSGKEPEQERDFLRFARSCDMLSGRLRKYGANPLGGRA